MVRFLGILFSLIIFNSYADATTLVPIEVQPEWITLKTVKLQSKVPKDEIQGGIYHLLVDKQTRVDKSGGVQAFRHFASVALTPEGVEQNSQINIVFDPNYQEIVVHKIVLWRNELEIDMIQTVKMALLQRENELEQLIYNGDTTLNILLENIRVNDIIEYSYSIKGNNPVFESAFSISHSLNWNVPLESIYIKILWKKTRPLLYDLVNSNLELNKKNVIGGTEYWIEADQITPLSPENNIPNWLDPYAYVRFSDTASWHEVVTWGKVLFDESIQVSPSISKLANQIAKPHQSKTTQIAEILKYVQKEVRYLGIEFGENSHRPSKAVDTLQRQYGDCKDKVVLLISLLSEIGVEAFPALVNTERGKFLDQEIPRYTAFDHVIALVEYEGKSYWLDPTRTNQNGELDDIFQPNYGYSLVLKDGQNNLTKVSISQKESKISVNETFHLYNDSNISTKYKIESVYDHLEADLIRSQLISKSLTKTREGYIDFYRSYYPLISTVNQAKFVDDKKNNVIKISEEYLVNEFWEKNESKGKFYADFYANLISPFLKIPNERQRKFSFYLSHPIVREQNIAVYFEDDNWELDNDEFIKDTKYFSYKVLTTYLKKERKLLLEYYYKSKVDKVVPEDFADYISALEEVKEHTSYGIFMYISESDSPEENTTAQKEYNFYLIALSVYFSLLVITVIWWRIDRKRNQYCGEMKYYPVSISKFLIFWVATFGIYAMYWNYKNWKYIKQRDSLHIMPFARGVFYCFWYYPLYKELAKDNNTTDDKTSIMPQFIAIILSIIFAFISLFGNFLGFEVVFLILTGLLIVPMASYINFRNRKHPSAIRYNSQWKINNILTLILCVPLFLMVLGSEVGILPSEKVIAGNKIMAYDIKYLQRKGVIKPNDKITYFYSDAFLSNRNDGNGFTERHVFSYWNENDGFQFESAEMKDIKKINVTWSNSESFDNTIIDIVREDDTSFLLYVSAIDKKDKIFVKHLKGSWKKLK